MIEMSLWEDVLTEADAIVVGAGLIGLNTALELRQLHPQWRILVVERGMFGTGASTRNAGFVCFGSASELWSDGINVETIAKRWSGLQRLASRGSDEMLGLQRAGGHELFTGHHECLDKLDDINDLLRATFGTTVFRHSTHRISEWGFGPQVTHTVSTELEGTLHSGLYMRLLMDLCAKACIRILHGTTVQKIVPYGKGHLHQLVCTCNERQITLTANTVVVATNCWPVDIEGVIAEKFTPGRGQIIVTNELPMQPLPGCFHYQEGFYYFRSIGKRVLLGGGRNTAIQEEESFVMATTTLTEHLEEMLRTMILPKQEFRIERSWAGIMGFSDNKEPRIRLVAPGIVHVMGCNGMGVALGITVATEAAATLTFAYGSST
jgi:glycine/D-amino acid oxidase-like deaminating enzyme